VEKDELLEKAAGKKCLVDFSTPFFRRTGLEVSREVDINMPGTATATGAWRASKNSAFGVALLLMYWTAHMDWPFIENRNNFIVDYHIVYATLCVYLVANRAEHVWGLDSWLERLSFIEQRPSLRFLVA
jgi:hypothetical protein